MRKVFLALALLANWSAARAQDDPKVTYSSACDSVDHLLKDLGPRIGLELRANSQIGRQIMSMDVTRVPRKELLTRFASLLGGEWSVNKDIWVLKRPLALDRKLAKLEVESRLRSYRDQLDQLRRDNADGAFDDSKAMALAFKCQASIDQIRTASTPEQRLALLKDVQTLSLRTPTGRLLLQLVSDDVLRTALPLPPNARLVYALRHTPAQLPLPLSEASLASYRTDQAAWVRAVDKFAPIRGTPASSLDPRYWADGEVDGRVLLVVQRHNSEDGLQASVLACDASGSLVAKAVLNLQAAPEVPRRIPAPRYESASILLGSEFNAIGAALRQFDVVNPESASFRTAWNAISSDSRDPLYWAADLLRLAVKSRGLQYIALLPDSVFNLYTQFDQSSPVAPTEVLNRLRPDATLTFDGSWATLKPKYPMREETFHIDRSPLRVLLYEITQGKSIELSSVADYARASQSGGFLKRFDLALVRLAARSVSAQGLSEDTLYNPREALAFIASLPSESWQALESGDSIQLGSLTQSQIELLSSIVYTTNGLLLLRDTSMVATAEKTLLGENTELLPNGIPATGTLSLTVSDKPVPTTTFSFTFNERAGYKITIQYKPSASDGGKLVSVCPSSTKNAGEAYPGFRVTR